MASMVLIPGAWLGGWVWTDVARDLRASGHEVFPITLTGLGDRAHLARPETDMMTHLRDVIAAIEMEELMDVVLVGHSYGSAVAGGVASEVPERIARTVFIDMAPIENGQSVFDSYPLSARGPRNHRGAGRGSGWGLAHTRHQ